MVSVQKGVGSSFAHRAILVVGLHVLTNPLKNGRAAWKHDIGEQILPGSDVTLRENLLMRLSWSNTSANRKRLTTTRTNNTTKGGWPVAPPKSSNWLEANTVTR